MTMKKLNLTVMVLAALTIMSSCSNDEAGVVQSIGEYVAQKEVPVGFGIYKGAAAETRAGSPGTISTTTQLKDKGFGVFAFDTEEKTFDGVTVSTTTRSLIPDFMYNEYITWHADATDPAKSEWVYADPNSTKYWPNDFAESAVDGRGTDAATGSTKHYISFFAYAPYAGVLSQGDATKHNGATSMSNDGTASGIVAVSGNNHNGDPIITYKLADDAKKVVDLLWGTAGGGQNGESVTGVAQPGAAVSRSVIEGTSTSETATAPTNINMTKQKTGGKIVFNFKHALAKMGGSAVGAEATNTKAGLTVDLIIDDVTGPTNVKKDNTKVTVRRIAITNYDLDGTTGTKTLFTPATPSKGEFNLATGKWNVLTTDHVTIDHVIDQTGSAGNKLNTDIMEPAAGVTAWADLTMAGVEETFKNVYAEEVFPLLFIPGTAPKLKFTVEYVVRTKDDKLAKGYTEVNQKISKVLTFPTLESNKQYNIAMHLGLTSIKFDATVSNWEVATGTGTGSGSGTSTEQPVDLPINVQ